MKKIRIVEIKRKRCYIINNDRNTLTKDMINYLNLQESSWLVKMNRYLVYYSLSSRIMKSNSGNTVKKIREKKDGTVPSTPVLSFFMYYTRR